MLTQTALLFVFLISLTLPRYVISSSAAKQIDYNNQRKVCAHVPFDLTAFWPKKLSPHSAQQHDRCNAVNPATIGLVYLFLPDRIEPTTKRRSSNNNNGTEPQGVVFKLHNYYALLAQARLFGPLSEQRPILFYYLNEQTRPASSFFNRWLSDPDWNSRVPLAHVRFISLNYSLPTVSSSSSSSSPTTEQVTNKGGNPRRHTLDMLDVIGRVRRDALERLRHRGAQVTHMLLVTSDVIVGPKLLSCFSRDTAAAGENAAASAVDRIRSSLGGECYSALHDDSASDHFSFLYKLDVIHGASDFSGAVIWRQDRAAAPLPLEVSQYNVYRCHYKNDIFGGANARAFADAFCVFGYELNVYEPPHVQDALFDAHNYFYATVRHWLYARGGGAPITYRRRFPSQSPWSAAVTQQVAAPSGGEIPNVVHLIWFGQAHKTLKYIEYLCLKSVLTVLRPDKVRVHGDIEPVGDDWQRLRRHPRLEWVPLERPVRRYGQDFGQSPIQHLADVARLEVLLAEGGIYSDFDILWVRALEPLRHYDVQLVAANDITSYCSEFPHNIQIGAFMAPRGSPFVRRWLDGYRNYHLFPGDYVAVSMCEPYKLYEKQPDKVLIDNRLQMIYFNGWSTFIPRYVDINQEKLAEFNDKLDWLHNGTHGYHLPRHGALFSRTDAKKANQSALPIRIANYIDSLSFDELTEESPAVS